jgi:hypothetical protein
MKNIHNILSDAFVAIRKDEADYRIEIDRSVEYCIRITIPNDSNDFFQCDVYYEQDGYIQSVKRIENTLLVTANLYTTFVNTIYNAEYMSI